MTKYFLVTGENQNLSRKIYEKAECSYRENVFRHNRQFCLLALQVYFRPLPEQPFNDFFSNSPWDDVVHILNTENK